jgi:hypothetical protein
MSEYAFILTLLSWCRELRWKLFRVLRKRIWWRCSKTPTCARSTPSVSRSWRKVCYRSRRGIPILSLRAPPFSSLSLSLSLYHSSTLHTHTLSLSPSLRCAHLPSACVVVFLVACCLIVFKLLLPPPSPLLLHPARS